MLITGANSGLGLRSARVLAAAGARVLMACRSPERGETALKAVTEAGGDAELITLDLADLGSVRAAAAEVAKRCPDGLDVLMNNAGVMATPKRHTADGFELQFGTNHLGHAALTWLLMPELAKRPGSRVVTLSSMAARGGRIDVTDPNFEHRRYLPTWAYGQAKLANLLFALELDRRLHAARRDITSTAERATPDTAAQDSPSTTGRDTAARPDIPTAAGPTPTTAKPDAGSAAGQDTISVAAHPGFTATELSNNMMRSRYSGAVRKIALVGAALADVVGQNVAMGALPQLYAATAPDVYGGEYIGPGNVGGTRGYPKKVALPRSALRSGVPEELWELTARLTGVAPDPA